RPHAVRILEALAYDGVVFLPESQGEQWRGNYDQQMAWELEAMRRSDVILFWIPATQDLLPAYTTRVEVGFQIHSGKVILGVPHNAYKTSYIQKFARQHHLVSYPTLEETVTAALAKLGGGAERSGAECLVPFEIWRAPHFQAWYTAQTA